MSQGKGPRVSVVVPVFNERATIEEILRRIQAVDLDKEIIIVDDGSTDGTKEIIAALAARAAPNLPRLPQSRELRADNVRVFFQGRNQGKGAALRRGFQEARGEIVIAGCGPRVRPAGVLWPD